MYISLSFYVSHISNKETFQSSIPLWQSSAYCIWKRLCDDELFLWYGWPTKGVKPYFQPGPLSEILTIANLRHAASRIWTCAEPEFRLCWMKLCSSDNHYTTAPHRILFSFSERSVFIYIGVKPEIELSFILSYIGSVITNFTPQKVKNFWLLKNC